MSERGEPKQEDLIRLKNERLRWWNIWEKRLSMREEWIEEERKTKLIKAKISETEREKPNSSIEQRWMFKGNAWGEEEETV